MSAYEMRISYWISDVCASDLIFVRFCDPDDFAGFLGSTHNELAVARAAVDAEADIDVRSRQTPCIDRRQHLAHEIARRAAHIQDGRDAARQVDGEVAFRCGMRVHVGQAGRQERGTVSVYDLCARWQCDFRPDIVDASFADDDRLVSQPPLRIHRDRTSTRLNS